MKIIYEPSGRALEYSLLAANLYRGCSHGCHYCYAPAALHMSPETFHGGAVPRPGILNALARDAGEIAGDDRRILLCFTCDPYPFPPVQRQPFEVVTGAGPQNQALATMTRAALEILKRNHLHWQVLTKAGLRAAGDFDLYGPGDAFATTLTFHRVEESLEMEPGAAVPSERVAAIEEAHRRGIETWVSLEPVFDAGDALAWIRRLHGIVDLWKIGTLNHVANPLPVDWPKFARQAVELLELLGCRYYIKADLAKHLAGVEYHNADTRRVGVH